MIHDIANYIEIKKNIKQLDRVYFTLAIEECLKFKDWNLEGFLIDKHKHSLKNIMLIKIKAQQFPLEINNESINLLDDSIQEPMRKLKSLMELCDSDRQFTEHLIKSLKHVISSKYYLDLMSLNEFKSLYLNGHAHALYEKTVIEARIDNHEEPSKKIIKV